MKYIKPIIEEIRLTDTYVFLDSSLVGPDPYENEGEIPVVPLPWSDGGDDPFANN